MIRIIGLRATWCPRSFFVALPEPQCRRMPDRNGRRLKSFNEKAQERANAITGEREDRDILSPGRSYDGLSASHRPHGTLILQRYSGEEPLVGQGLTHSGRQKWS